MHSLLVFVHGEDLRTRAFKSLNGGGATSAASALPDLYKNPTSYKAVIFHTSGINQFTCMNAVCVAI